MRQARRAHNAGWHVLTEGGAVADNSPTLRAKRLGNELKRLRLAVGKTQKEVGDWVGTPHTTISKIETADRNVPLPHLKLMLQLYGVNPTQSAALVQLAEQAKERGWWAEYGVAVPDWFEDYVGLETAATEVWTYEAEYVPGLLQTARYTQALTRATSTAEPPDDGGLAGFAAVRAVRQRRLVDDEPLALSAVLNEAVLLREVGGPEVMREQLASLLTAAGRPNITLQVLPFSVGTHPGMHGPFTILRFMEESMNTVYVELRGGAVYQDTPVDIELHSTTFEQLTALALTAEDTISLLRETERRL